MSDLPRRRVLGGLVLTALSALSAPRIARADPPQATPPELQTHWSGTAPPRLQGQGRLRFLGLSIYDIRLWAGPGGPIAATGWPRQGLALEIIYQRGLVGRLIAERSLREMERTGPIQAAQAEAWLQQMTALFPDVAEGDRLTGLYTPDSATPARFFHNAKPRGEVGDADFARRFFGIWLDEKTSEPALRDQLLGLR